MESENQKPHKQQQQQYPGDWISFVSCFHQVKEGGEYYTNGYCIGNLFIQLSSYVVFAQCMAILIWHFKRKGIANTSTYYSSASWLLICMLIFELLVVLRYTFNLYAAYRTYMGLEVTENMLASIVMFLVCYYFTKKASALLSKETSQFLILFLRIVGVICFALFLFTAIYQGIEFKGKVYSRVTISDLCVTPGFLVPEVLNLLLSILFIAIGIKISKGNKQARAKRLMIKNAKEGGQNQVLQQMESTANFDLSSPDVADSVLNVARSDEMDNKLQQADRNMWFVIIALAIINLYNFLYSITIIVLPNGECHLNITWVFNLNTIINRYVVLILWPLPIIYMFWPSGRNVCGCLKKEYEVNEIVYGPISGRESTIRVHEQMENAAKDFDSDSEHSGLNVQNTYLNLQARQSQGLNWQKPDENGQIGAGGYSNGSHRGGSQNSEAVRTQSNQTSNSRSNLSYNN